MFKIGDKVKWIDPAINDYPIEDREDALNRIFNIISINGDIILISDGETEVEVFEEELTKI